MMGPSPVKPMAVVVGGLVVLLIAVEVGIVPDVSPQPDEEMGFVEECADRGGELVFNTSDSENELYCEVGGEREYYEGDVETTVESGTVSLGALPE